MLENIKMLEMQTCQDVAKTSNFNLVVHCFVICCKICKVLLANISIPWYALTTCKDRKHLPRGTSSRAWRNYRDAIDGQSRTSQQGPGWPRPRSRNLYRAYRGIPIPANRCLQTGIKYYMLLKRFVKFAKVVESSICGRICNILEMQNFACFWKMQNLQDFAKTCKVNIVFNFGNILQNFANIYQQV